MAASKRMVNGKRRKTPQTTGAAAREPVAPLPPWLRGDRSGLPMKPSGKGAPSV